MWKWGDKLIILKNFTELSEKKNITFLPGYFKTFHLGHKRIVNLANQLGGTLVVGLLDHSDYEVRAKHISEYQKDGYIINIDNNLLGILSELKPSVLVRGFEHFHEVDTKEIEIVNSYGGKVFFASGTINDEHSKKPEIFAKETISLKTCEKFKTDHSLIRDYKKFIENFTQLNVTVVGDTIIDRYVDCNIDGVSKEDPAIVVNPYSEKMFLGGAAIVASHIQSLGAKTQFFSLANEDENSDWVKGELHKIGIKTEVFSDGTKKTLVKTRYRANGKNLLRVNNISAPVLNRDLQEKMLDRLKSCLESCDLLIFSDFSYGCLSEEMVGEVIKICKKNNVLMAADSQSSSQLGDINKFIGVDLITPTEYEARLANNELNQSLTKLVDNLYDDLDVSHIIVTLGEEGAFVQEKQTPDNTTGLRSDQIESLALNIKNISGSGDVFLSVASLMMASGATIWEMAYLGSIASAIHINSDTISALKKEDLIAGLQQ